MIQPITGTPGVENNATKGSSAQSALVFNAHLSITVTAWQVNYIVGHTVTNN